MIISASHDDGGAGRQRGARIQTEDCLSLPLSRQQYGEVQKAGRRRQRRRSAVARLVQAITSRFANLLCRRLPIGWELSETRRSGQGAVLQDGILRYSRWAVCA